MVEQNFVGDKPVDMFSEDAVKKVDDKELTHRGVHRDIASQPGATKREGVASRDPAGKCLTKIFYHPCDS